MDIEPAYTCLLGRPWTHAAEAVTSTLHQKLKFLIKGKLVVINKEEDIFVSQLESYRYISFEEDCIATPFQVLEVASIVTVVPQNFPPFFLQDIFTRSTFAQGCLRIDQTNPPPKQWVHN